jgi:hypothetical protein
MRKKIYAAAVLTILITAGCHYGAINKNWGKSYDSATSGQIMNPKAAKNLKPTTGLEGGAADATMKKYTSSFSASSQASQGSQGFALTPIVPSTEGAGAGNVYGK